MKYREISKQTEGEIEVNVDKLKDIFRDSQADRETINY